MMPVTTILGLGACAFMAAITVLAVLPLAARPLSLRIIIGIGLTLLMLVPIDGLVLAGYVRGAIGDPSVTTLLLFACIAVRKVTGRELFDDGNLLATMTLILAGAASLYPMAMGLGPYDPYALGFGSWWLYAPLVAISLMTWWRGLYLPLACIVMGTAAFVAGAFESTNLWNYLIDPIAVIFAVFWLLGHGVRAMIRRDPRHEAAAA